MNMQNQKLNQPQPPLQPYYLYKQKILKQYPDLGEQKIMLMWQNLDEQDREKYHEEFQILQKQWQNDYNNWEEKYKIEYQSQKVKNEVRNYQNDNESKIEQQQELEEIFNLELIKTESQQIILQSNQTSQQKQDEIYQIKQQKAVKIEQSEENIKKNQINSQNSTKITPKNIIQNIKNNSNELIQQNQENISCSNKKPKKTSNFKNYAKKNSLLNYFVVKPQDLIQHEKIQLEKNYNPEFQTLIQNFQQNFIQSFKKFYSYFKEMSESQKSLQNLGIQQISFWNCNQFINKQLGYFQLYCEAEGLEFLKGKIQFIFMLNNNHYNNNKKFKESEIKNQNEIYQDNDGQNQIGDMSFDSNIYKDKCFFQSNYQPNENEILICESIFDRSSSQKYSTIQIDINEQLIVFLIEKGLLLKDEIKKFSKYTIQYEKFKQNLRQQIKNFILNNYPPRNY